jgi:hypothetical protein
VPQVEVRICPWPLPAHPLFDAVRAASFVFDRLWPSLAEVNRQLGPCLQRWQLPHVFVAPTVVPKRQRRFCDLYEARIALDQQIPWRSEDAHDLMNALVWASFPRAKAALAVHMTRTMQHDWQVRDVDSIMDRLPNARSAQRDGLAMIDEGSVLRVRFGGRISLWGFGHGLLEQAANDPMNMTTLRPRVIDLSCAHDLPAVDEALLHWLQQSLTGDRVSASVGALWPAVSP